jgi:excisionase family DNA binding protein
MAAPVANPGNDASRTSSSFDGSSDNTSVLSLAGDDQELLTLEQVAAILKTRPSTIRGWVREGRMPCVRLGPRCTRWTRPALRQWVAENTDLGDS